MPRGRHAQPSNTGRNIQRAAIGGIGGLASFSFVGSPIVAIAAPVEVWTAAQTTPILVPDETEREKQVMREYRELPPAVPVAAPLEHVVVEGDTLSKIAASASLPSWEPLYVANQAVIGDNPDLIFPEQRLVVGGIDLAAAPVPVDVPEVSPTPPAPPVDEHPNHEPIPAPAPPAETENLAQAVIYNTAGPVSARAQEAANQIWANVPGASLISIGGTRGSARDPNGHPSGNALDYMVMNDTALGDAILQYHFAHWDALGVEYVIWKQRYFSAPYTAGTWMEDRGSATQNHMDHPHVNYKP